MYVYIYVLDGKFLGFFFPYIPKRERKKQIKTSYRSLDLMTPTKLAKRKLVMSLKGVSKCGDQVVIVLM